ncbi:MAG: pilus assembly protein [Planctomycetaceae bacterium]|nr:pilus assembly protein [Planctomycetaceae bacterium]
MQRAIHHLRTRRQPRRAAATVEFAVTLPLFLMLLMGMAEISCALNATQTLHGALRDAGRLASMDYKQILGESVDPNAKIMQDIRNLLTASGIPGDQVTLAIVYSGGANDGAPFDLSDDDNYLELFRIEASVPYTAVSTFPLEYLTGTDLVASVTFRKGRVSLVSPS